MVKIVSQFVWSLIVIDGTKVICRILGMMHMTRKIASEEQDESMANIEPPPLKIKTFHKGTPLYQCCLLTLKLRNSI